MLVQMKQNALLALQHDTEQTFFDVVKTIAGHGMAWHVCDFLDTFPAEVAMEVEDSDLD